MLRIVVLVLAVAAFASGRPSYLHSSVVPYGYEIEPTVIGHTLHSIPTAVSHQSQTIVHEKRPYLRPIVEHISVPVVKTYAVPEIIASPYYSGGYSGWDNGYGGLKTASYGGWNRW
ncbi:uncharacterized protein LOC129909337 [Episyrphus balteatus]|uniref:uncharacterized protein LOC129909337 n=1 Tax=Episyrphus balteatus TaxID=286459 RepID=UPI0024858B52|nr:uncharacterized protein LOC129909337 [Episyrphus balteatus]